MRKQIIRGWAGKSGTWWFRGKDGHPELMIFPARGHQIEWDAEDWPPVRVKVTIEVMPNSRICLNGQWMSAWKL